MSINNVANSNSNANENLNVANSNSNANENMNVANSSSNANENTNSNARMPLRDEIGNKTSSSTSRTQPPKKSQTHNIPVYIYLFCASEVTLYMFQQFSDLSFQLSSSIGLASMLMLFLYLVYSLVVLIYLLIRVKGRTLKDINREVIHKKFTGIILQDYDGFGYPSAYNLLVLIKKIF